MKSRNLLTKILMIPLFGLLILSFAVWGIGDIFRGGGNAQSIATVGDTVIDQRSYSQELSREIAIMSRRFGTTLSLEQARAFGIPQQVLNRMISRALIDEMANQLGLLVTEEQMRTQILENPGFQDATGDFDRNRFELSLREQGLTEAGFLDSLSRDTKRRQLIEALSEGAVAPQSIAQQLFAYREERRVADYVVMPNDSVTDVGEPDAAAIQETYDSASASFMTPEYKAITVVVLATADAAAEIAISDEAIVEEFEARRDELSTPERREIVQAVLPDEATAKAMAETIAAGAEFAAAAEEATGREPVALGLMAEADLLPELGGPIFQLEVGKVSDPIQSPLGWHLALVTEVQEGAEASLENFRDQLREELSRAQAVDIVIDQANRFDEAIAAGLPLEEAARSLNISPRTIPAIDNQGQDESGNRVDALPSLNEFIPVLNDTAVNDTSLLTETLDGDYFIIRVDGVTAPALKALDEVREDVVRLWQVRERARINQERADALVASLETGADFTELAESEGLTIERTEAITRFESNPERTPDPAVSQQLFDIKEGEVTLAITQGRLIIAKLVEVMGGEEDGRDERLEQLSAQLSSALSDDIFQQMLASLRNEFALSINEGLLQESLAGASY